MADLTLKGTLNLMGNLTLKDKVKVGGETEALVQVTPSDSAQGNAPPVILPPPPAAPIDPQPGVWIVSSFNQTVKAGTKPIVALGMVMQGAAGAPIWPGMMLPSSANSTVTINHVPINIKGDMAVIFPSGGSATFNASGQ